MSRLVSSFVPKMNRALQAAMEAKILSVGPDAQTAASTNAINGASHRWIGQGTNETIAPQDFAKALYALQKANVPLTNLVAIVDPSVEYALNTLSNLVNARLQALYTAIAGAAVTANDGGASLKANIITALQANGWPGGALTSTAAAQFKAK